MSPSLQFNQISIPELGSLALSHTVFQLIQLTIPDNEFGGQLIHA